MPINVHHGVKDLQETEYAVLTCDACQLFYELHCVDVAYLGKFSASTSNSIMYPVLLLLVSLHERGAVTSVLR